LVPGEGLRSVEVENDPPWSTLARVGRKKWMKYRREVQGHHHHHSLHRQIPDQKLQEGLFLHLLFPIAFSGSPIDPSSGRWV